MKNMLLVFIVCVYAVIACKQKDDPNQKTYISVPSLIKQQVAHIDTGLYSILKIVSTDSLHIDTTYIPREQFGSVAAEFLAVPDLSNKKIAKRFKEDMVQYDSLLNRVIFIYAPVDPAKEEVKKIELLVTPVLGAESKISSILVNTSKTNRDSSVQKQMLWLTDKHFQISSTVQKPGKPDLNTFTKVTWNDAFSQ